MTIKIKRAYDSPAKSDGTRILVDRLWPRGISKDAIEIEAWMKDFTPSNKLRVWFHEDPEKRRAEFKKRYRSELQKNKLNIQKDLRALKKTVTLVTAVRDIEHSHLPTLKTFLESCIR